MGDKFGTWVTSRVWSCFCPNNYYSADLSIERCARCQAERPAGPDSWEKLTADITAKVNAGHALGPVEFAIWSEMKRAKSSEVAATTPVAEAWAAGRREERAAVASYLRTPSLILGKGGERLAKAIENGEHLKGGK